MVCTNTTVYKETDMQEIEELFEYLEQFNVDGHQIAPAYGYSAVERPRDLHDARRHSRKVQGYRPAWRSRYYVRQTPLYLDFLKGDAGLAVHRLGQSDLQHQGLEGPVLPDHRRPLQDLRGADDADALGKLRPRQRSALRALHDALRLRAFGRAGHHRQPGRQFQDAGMGAEMTCGQARCLRRHS